MNDLPNLPLQCTPCKKIHLASQRIYTRATDFEGKNIHVCPHCRGIPPVSAGKRDELDDGRWMLAVGTMRTMKSYVDWVAQAPLDPKDFPLPERKAAPKPKPVAAATVVLECGCNPTNCECWKAALD